MAAVSQKELDKVVATNTKTGKAGGAADAPKNPRMRKFAGLYNKSFSSDNSCALTQDELDRVLGTKS
jgi:hypothetical protein